MSISLPFKGVRISVPFGVISENNKYRVCIGEHRTEALPFKASLFSCIEDIQKNVKPIVMHNPKYLELVPYTADGNTDTKELNPVNNDEFVFSFVQLWCQHWRISLQDLSNLAKLSVRKPEPFTGPIKPITFISTASSTYNMFMNNGTGTGSISYISSSTTNSTNPYYSSINNVDNLEIIIDTDVVINFMYMPPINMNDNDTFIEPERDSFNLRSINSEYQYMLTVNADIYNGGYVIKDLLKLPYEKFLYFKTQYSKVLELFKEQTHLYEQATMANLEKIKVSLVECTKESHYYGTLCHMMPNMLKTMYMLIPDHLKEFPLDGFCYVPALSTKPKTDLQWALCNHISKQKHTEWCASMIYENKHRSIRIKENTKLLLPYLNVTDKLMDDYCAYSNVIKPENPSVDWYENNFTGLLKLIDDGKKIYAMYPEPMEIEGIGTLKMSSIHGSLLRQLQNSIYNHREEVKVSLEQKLAVLLANDTNKDTLAEPVHKVSDALETYRITKKSHLIHLGKLLGHCIGTKTDSTNMFFRKDTVCAQVNEHSLYISTCLDAKNKNTDKSSAFKAELEELFYLMKKEIILPSILELRGITEEQLDTGGNLKTIVEAEFKKKYDKTATLTGMMPEGLRNDLARQHGVDLERVLGEALEDVQGQVANARVQDEYRNRYLAQRPHIDGIMDINYNGNIENHHGQIMLGTNYNVIPNATIGVAGIV